MKLLFNIIILFSALTGYSQIWQGKIVDAETNTPLGYVSITYKKSTVYSFTDSAGNFYINKSIVSPVDTIILNYVGYKNMSYPLSKVLLTGTLKMKREIKDLEKIEVVACPDPEEIEVNNKHTSTMGVSPGIKLIFIGVYDCCNDKYSYLNEISYFVSPSSKYLQIPIQLHWYEWDEKSQSPGKELTDTLITHVPSKGRWNKFSLPPKLIVIDSRKLVLGIEFIYPTEVQKDFWTSDNKKKNAWFYENREWHLGMIKSENESFEKFSVEPILPSRIHEKPALKLKIKVCK